LAGDFIRKESNIVEIDVRDPVIMKKNELPLMVDSMFFIKLPDEPLLGNVDKLILCDSLIYILDAFQTQQALIYDIHKNSLTKISSRGRGPNEYIGLFDMSVNKERPELVLNDGYTGQKLVSDLSGKFIRKEPIMPSVYFDCVENTYINQVGYRQSYQEDINYHIVTSNQDSVINKAFHFYPIQKNNYVSKGFSRNWRDDLLFMPTYCDTVYCIDSDSTYYVRYILHQKKSLWKQANEQLTDKETIKMIKEEGYSRINGFWEGRNHIIFMMDKSHSSGRVLSSQHIHNKRTGVTYEYPNSDNSPMTPAVVENDVPFDYYTLSHPKAMWGDFFVSVFDPMLLNYVWNEAVSQGITIKFRDPKFEDMIKNAKHNSNLALVLYRPK
jgi:hypothetical protein